MSGLFFTDDDFDQFDKPGAERSWRRRAADEDWDRCVHTWASLGCQCDVCDYLMDTEIFTKDSVLALCCPVLHQPHCWADGRSLQASPGPSPSFVVGSCAEHELAFSLYIEHHHNHLDATVPFAVYPAQLLRFGIFVILICIDF